MLESNNISVHGNVNITGCKDNMSELENTPIPSSNIMRNNDVKMIAPPKFDDTTDVNESDIVKSTPATIASSTKNKGKGPAKRTNSKKNVEPLREISCNALVIGKFPKRIKEEK